MPPHEWIATTDTAGQVAALFPACSFFFSHVQFAQLNASVPPACKLTFRQKREGPL